MRETGATTGTSADSAEVPPTDDSVPAGAQPDPEPDADTGSAGDSGSSAADAEVVDANRSGTETSSRPDESGPRPSAGSGSSPRPDSPPSRPQFTRPPGMTPPPERLDGDDRRADSGRTTPGVPSSPVLSGPPRVDPSGSGAYPVVSASAPVSSPPRVTGRATAGPGTVATTTAPPESTTTSGVTLRPIGPGAGSSSSRTSESLRSARSATTPRGPRRARLSVKRIDPWSVMKFSFAVSLVLFIVVIVAASVLYLALDSMGVFTSINETVADLVESGGGAGSTFRITARGVIGTAAVLGALNVLLFTSLATLGAFIYNVCADLVGGVEVTLAERD